MGPVPLRRLWARDAPRRHDVPFRAAHAHRVPRARPGAARRGRVGATRRGRTGALDAHRPRRVGVVRADVHARRHRAGDLVHRHSAAAADAVCGAVPAVDGGGRLHWHGQRGRSVGAAAIRDRNAVGVCRRVPRDPDPSPAGAARPPRRRSGAGRSVRSRSCSWRQVSPWSSSPGPAGSAPSSSMRFRGGRPRAARGQSVPRRSRPEVPRGFRLQRKA